MCTNTRIRESENKMRNHNSQRLSGKTMPSFALASWGEREGMGSSVDRMPQWAGFLDCLTVKWFKNNLLGWKRRKGTPNGRQKCVGISPLPPPSPPPPQTTLNFEQNGWKWLLYRVKLSWGGVRGRRDEPKADEKNWIMGRLLGTVFSSGQSSCDLH